MKAGGRQINYDQFIAALRHLATRRFPKKDEDAAFAALKKLIAKSQGPATTGATVCGRVGVWRAVSTTLHAHACNTAQVADTSGVYSKFTDESGYTGAHAARFADVPKVRATALRTALPLAYRDPIAGSMLAMLPWTQQWHVQKLWKRRPEPLSPRLVCCRDGASAHSHSRLWLPRVSTIRTGQAPSKRQS